MKNQKPNEKYKPSTGLMEILYSIRDKAAQKGDVARLQRINESIGEIVLLYQDPVFLRRQMD